MTGDGWNPTRKNGDSGDGADGIGWIPRYGIEFWVSTLTQKNKDKNKNHEEKKKDRGDDDDDDGDGDGDGDDNALMITPWW